eukprot:698487-Rhodomonas_salina.1
MGTRGHRHAQTHAHTRHRQYGRVHTSVEAGVLVHVPHNLLPVLPSYPISVPEVAHVPLHARRRIADTT